MVAQVIQAGKASLRELRECYSLHDLYDMWEIVHDEAYKKWLAFEEQQKRKR